MLKRIPTSSLALGMFVQELPGDWQDRSFWRKKFLLTNPADLDRLRASGVPEVWIDTGLGLDVPEESADGPAPEPDGTATCPARTPNAEPTASRSTARAMASGSPAMAPERSAIAPERSGTTPEPPATDTVGHDATGLRLGQEVETARRICESARTAVKSMFDEVRLGKSLRQAEVVEMVDEIAGSVARNAGAIVSLARIKTVDDYTYMHSVAVCALMVALARQLGLDDSTVRKAGVAGLLHDVGKIDVPTEILNKPGKLTDDEFEIARRHPAMGYRRLVDSGVASAETLDVCLHHHERIDGSGYPDGLSDKAISQLARMGAICDVYDAVTSVRAYKAPWDPSESLRRMASWRGHFDVTILHAFVSTVGIYPIGAPVLLDDGTVAVVIDQTPGKLLRPVVLTAYSTSRNAPVSPQRLDLSTPGCTRRIVARAEAHRARCPTLEEILEVASPP